MRVSGVPPGPKGHFLLGMLPEIRRDELDFLWRLVHEYGDIVYLRVVNHPVYILSHPRDIETVLLTKSKTSSNRFFCARAKPFLGMGC